MANTFIFYGEWIDNIKGLPVEEQDKILADIVRYGTRRELQHEDDSYTSSIVNMLKGRIDTTIADYENKVEMSKTAGRKKKVNDKQIYDMAREGNTASQIALELGCSKETIDKAFKYQIVDMLGKPFNESSIRSAVEKTIYYKEMMQKSYLFFFFAK